MVTPPTPVCIRCGGPVFNHILRGYVCPYCRQLDATRKIAKQQARQAAAQQQQQYHQQPVYYENQNTDYSNQGESAVESVVGALVAWTITLAGVVFIISVILGIIAGIWNVVIHPVLHFLSFGVI